MNGLLPVRERKRKGEERKVAHKSLSPELNYSALGAPSPAPGPLRRAGTEAAPGAPGLQELGAKLEHPQPPQPPPRVTCALPALGGTAAVCYLRARSGTPANSPAREVVELGIGMRVNQRCLQSLLPLGRRCFAPVLHGRPSVPCAGTVRHGGGQGLTVNTSVLFFFFFF